MQSNYFEENKYYLELCESFFEKLKIEKNKQKEEILLRAFFSKIYYTAFLHVNKKYKNEIDRDIKFNSHIKIILKLNNQKDKFLLVSLKNWRVSSDYNLEQFNEIKKLNKEELINYLEYYLNLVKQFLSKDI